MPRVTSSSQIVDVSPSGSIVSGLEEQRNEMLDTSNIEDKKIEPTPTRQDVFGDETHAEVKYKVLKWW